MCYDEGESSGSGRTYHLGFPVESAAALCLRCCPHSASHHSLIQIVTRAFRPPNALGEFAYPHTALSFTSVSRATPPPCFLRVFTRQCSLQLRLSHILTLVAFHFPDRRRRPQRSHAITDALQTSVKGGFFYLSRDICECLTCFALFWRFLSFSRGGVLRCTRAQRARSA